MAKKNVIGVSSQIKKIDFDHIEVFLKTCDIKIPATILLELFKANFFSDYIDDTTVNESFYNFVTRFTPEKIKKANDLYKFEMKLLRKVEYLYQMKNTLLIKEFLRTVPANQRSRLLETLDLNNIELYIYSIILNARKNNKRITNNEIIYYVKHYKKYEINSEFGIDQVIKKIRKKVWHKLNACNIVQPVDANHQTTSELQKEQEEELINNVVNIIHTLSFKLSGQHSRINKKIAQKLLEQK